MNLLIMVLIRPKIRIFGHLERLDFETCYSRTDNFLFEMISEIPFPMSPIFLDLAPNWDVIPTPKSSQHNINLSVIMSEIMSLINR